MRLSDVLSEVGRPVAYYPGLVKHLGSINAVLFFCQIFYWQKKTDNSLGVYKVAEEIEEETGMTYREQATARKHLVSRGVLVETHKRLEHRIYFKINVDRLDEIMSSADCGVVQPRNALLSSGELTNTHSDHTENTTEITSENKPLVAADAATAGDGDSDHPNQSARIPYQQIADLYNQVCGEVLPQCLKLNTKRKAAIKKIWNMDIQGDYLFRDLDSWEGYFNDCLTSRHWTGHNDRGWKADIDFLLRETSVLRVLEALS